MGISDLPTYISLKEAAEQYSISIHTLRQAVEDDVVRAARVNGDIVVANEDLGKLAKRHLLWSKVKHLDGNPIGVENARKKYRLGAASLARWINVGYVRVLHDQRGGGRGHKRTLNEADVAYAALVAEERGRRRGRKIFIPEFVPPHHSTTQKL